MTKKIQFDSEARKSLQEGVDKAVNAVKCTLGPKGKTVIYYRPGMFSPSATKDGVTVAKEIELPDIMENQGAQIVKEVASKTGDEAGDGTTTSMVLAQAIITAGLKKVASGANPIDLKRGMDKAVIEVVKSIKKQSIQVDEKKILNIATISANNDEEIGSLISSAMNAVGKDGVIKVQESKGLDTEMKIVEGMEFDRGWLSPYFVTNYAKRTAELTQPLILIIDKKISVITEKFIPLITAVIKTESPLLIICDDMDGEALTSFAMNKQQGRMKVCVVKVPGYTEDQKQQNMEDIAALTGAKIVGDERGSFIEELTTSDLGMADNAIISERGTTIIGGKGDELGINQRIEQVKNSLENSKDERELSFLRSRLSRLSGKVAILFIGAGSDVEMGEKKDRVDDALHATRAAVQEGIVAGGGVAYIRAIKEIEAAKGLNRDEIDGIQIIRRAIEEPMRHIVNNSVGTTKTVGLIPKIKEFIFGSKADNIVKTIKNGEGGFGYNARTEIYEDLIIAGVIDPAKVERVAIQNATSVASMILTTECLIVEETQ